MFFGMERDIRNSLETLANFVYLAKASAGDDAKAAVSFLERAKRELDLVIEYITRRN